MINLEPGERRALGKLAKDELRDPKDQIRFIILKELEHRGYLSYDENSNLKQENSFREPSTEGKN